MIKTQLATRDAIRTSAGDRVIKRLCCDIRAVIPVPDPLREPFEMQCVRRCREIRSRGCQVRIDHRATLDRLLVELSLFMPLVEPSVGSDRHENIIFEDMRSEEIERFPRDLETLPLMKDFTGKI